MKRIISVILCAALTACFVSCGENADTQSNASPSSDAVSAAAESDVPEKNGSDILVVYFSATGSTKKVAQSIANKTEADLFEIVPSDPYTDDDLDYTDSDSRVVYEHDHPEARNTKLVTVSPENWDKYGTVFIGYPIWWGIAAWPTGSFVSENDFSGKTVIPFATSASSGLGDSGKLLGESAGTGNWQDGKRFSSYADESTVAEWLSSINY